MSDWDAARYHRISGPQFEWGLRVLARLQPAPGERILDLGCGTGRITEALSRMAGGGLVVGVDRSAAMVAVARAEAPAGPGPIRYVQADGTALPFRQAFDAVFSTATLHWITGHDALFASVAAALRPGGRFVAQCGGEGNLHRLLARTRQLIAKPPFEPYFRDWQDTWYFAGPAATERRLEDAGFAGVRAWLEDAPVRLSDGAAYAEFVACVCIRHHLDRLPRALRDPFVAELASQAAADSPPYVLDYRRLNIDGRTAA